MAKYRARLPQLDGGLFLTDGGIETTLIFHDGFDLPCFAAFPLLKDDAGRQAVADYFRRHAAIARVAGTGARDEEEGQRGREGEQGSEAALRAWSGGEQAGACSRHRVHETKCRVRGEGRDTRPVKLCCKRARARNHRAHAGTVCTRRSAESEAKAGTPGQ